MSSLINIHLINIRSQLSHWLKLSQRKRIMYSPDVSGVEISVHGDVCVYLAGVLTRMCEKVYLVLNLTPSLETLCLKLVL